MSDLLASLIRRWPLTLVLLLLGGGVGYLTLMVVAPDYEAKATMLLVPPESSEDPGGNRYLQLGGLTPARDIVIRSLNADAVHDAVLTGQPGASYEVSQDFSSSTPFIIIRVTAPTAASSDAVLSRLVNEVPKVLTSMQDQLGTQASVRITTLDITQDDPKLVGKKQIRAVVATTGAFFVMGALLVGLLDRRLLTRRSRRMAALQDHAAAPGARDVVNKRDGVGTYVVADAPDEIERLAESTADASTPESAADESAADESAADESAADESAADESAADESAADESAADESAADESAADESAADESAADESAADESAADESAADESAADESAADESAADESAADESAADESAADESAADESAADESAADEPTADESAADEPTADEPTADEPTADESAADEPTADESAADEPTANEPTADEPTADEPTADESAADEPTADERAPDGTTPDGTTPHRRPVAQSASTRRRGRPGGATVKPRRPRPRMPRAPGSS